MNIDKFMWRKYLVLPLCFEHLWLFLPALLFCLYVPQMFFGAFVFRDLPSFYLVAVVLLGFSAYLLVYFCLSRSKFFESKTFGFSFRGEVFSSHALTAIFVFYFALIAYLVFTSEKIALWEALSGASADDIARARESLLKNRVGWEKMLVYANAVFSSALMPFAVAICYLEKRAFRHALLFMFAVSLLPSLEKVLILKALLPLIVLGFNGYFPRRRSILLSVIAAVIISGAFYFSKMGKNDQQIDIQRAIRDLQQQQLAFSEMPERSRKSIQELQTNRENQQAAHAEAVKKGQKSLEELREQKKIYENQKSNEASIALKNIDAQIDFYAHEQPRQLEEMYRSAQSGVDTQIDFYENEQPRQIRETEKVIQTQLTHYVEAENYLRKYSVFGSGQLLFSINRVFWIPYVTAYDWVGFFYKNLAGEYLLGRTSGLLSWITGRTAFPMEKEVFKYQFGDSGPPTAAANACFLVDAFVNFGWLGVIVYAAIFAALTRIVVVQNNPAMKACYYYFTFQVSMGGLSGVLLSNGMLMVILLAFFIRPKPECAPR